MSGFFDSIMVRKSIEELDEIQQEIYDEMFQLSFFNNNQKKKHLDKMKLFLEKQKVFMFRMSLSDDPEAIEMKNKILESAQIFGLKPGDNLNNFFNKMEESLNKLEKTLDN